MQRYGSSTGNGAGWPTFRADSVGNVQRLFVHSRNWSLVIVSSRPFFCRLYTPFEKTRIYSWTSRSVGFDAEHQLPHAVETPAPEALFQITSPRIRNPISFIRPMIWLWYGM